MAKVRRGNHGERAPVETVPPGKRQTGTRGNRLPVETKGRGTRGNRKVVSTGARFCKRGARGNGIPAEKSDVETSPLVSTGARRRFPFPRVPNRAPVETNTPGQTWKRAPVETVSPGQTWKPLRTGHPWKPFSSLYHKGMSSTYMIVPRDNTIPLAYWPPRGPVHNATTPKWFPRVPVLV